MDVVWRPLPTGELDPVDVARFAKNVDISAGLYACWPWMGSRTGQGYGQARRHRKQVTAHRFSLELKLGRPIAPGMFACHHCDNPPCVNPHHLYEGTQADNARDMVERGRAHRLSRPTVFARGEQINMAKLTADQVREIRASDALQSELAERFGVDDSTISRVRGGRTWAHVR